MRVRATRHRLACLRTDSKQVQSDLEAKLLALHSAAAASASFANHAGLPATYIRVAAVEDAPDCPAALAGLRAGDRLAKVDGRTVQSLQEAASAIRLGEGLSVALLVVRGDEVLTLTLHPRAWSGRGIVGCHLLAI